MFNGSSGGGDEAFPHLPAKFILNIAVKGSLRLKNRFRAFSGIKTRPYINRTRKKA